jgi:hypothetical protein
MSPRIFPGGDERARTADPLLAKQVLSQSELHPRLSPEDTSNPTAVKKSSKLTAFASMFLLVNVSLERR